MTSRAFAVAFTLCCIGLPRLADARQDPSDSSTAAAASSDSDTSHLFFSATGDTLRRGEGFAGAYDFGVYPHVQVGLTDRLSVGIGTPLVIPGRALWVTPKFQIYRGASTRTAVGIAHVTGFDGAGLGFAYVASTTGHANALTTTIGLAYAYDDRHTGYTVAGVLGYEHRMSARTSFINENVFIDTHLASMLGWRRAGKRFSIDGGLMFPVNRRDFSLAPFLNFGWKF